MIVVMILYGSPGTRLRMEYREELTTAAHHRNPRTRPNSQSPCQKPVYVITAGQKGSIDYLQQGCTAVLSVYLLTSLY